jgi:hypothetical protein
MNEEEMDMFNSLLPGNDDLEVGEYARYREGIARADVKILSKNTDETNWTTYELEVTGNGNWGYKTGDVFTVGKREGYTYVGWTLKPLAEMN